MASASASTAAAASSRCCRSGPHERLAGISPGSMRSGSAIGSRSAARAGASVSCSAPASPCRRDSSCGPQRSSAASRRSSARHRCAQRSPASTPDDLEALTACSKTLRRRIEEAELPAEVRDALYGAHQRLVRASPEQPVAVRSSATCEDAADASFAGLQDTYLWVRGARADRAAGAQLLGESLFGGIDQLSPASTALPEERVAMAVVVQHMVDARTAGVMFTRSPTTGTARW